MASVNRVTLLGNLGQDPETRYMPSGDAVTNISMATNEQWKDKAGELQKRTEWHRVVFFGKLAEVASQYLEKGNPVYIEGHLRTRRWTDKNEIERFTTEIVADRIQLLNSSNGRPPQPPVEGQPVKPAAKASDGLALDDDIPF